MFGCLGFCWQSLIGKMTWWPDSIASDAPRNQDEEDEEDEAEVGGHQMIRNRSELGRFEAGTCGDICGMFWASRQPVSCDLRPCRMFNAKKWFVDLRCPTEPNVETIRYRWDHKPVSIRMQIWRVKEIMELDQKRILKHVDCSQSATSYNTSKTPITP